jgi:hypothetical protein
MRKEGGGRLGGQEEVRADRASDPPHISQLLLTCTDLWYATSKRLPLKQF